MEGLLSALMPLLGVWLGYFVSNRRDITKSKNVHMSVVGSVHAEAKYATGSLDMLKAQIEMVHKSETLVENISDLKLDDIDVEYMKILRIRMGEYEKVDHVQLYLLSACINKINFVNSNLNLSRLGFARSSDNFEHMVQGYLDGIVMDIEKAKKGLEALVARMEEDPHMAGRLLTSSAHR